MISVVLVRSPKPRAVEELPLQLPDGATIAEALAMVGWSLGVDGSKDSTWTCGVWGRKEAQEPCSGTVIASSCTGR